MRRLIGILGAVGILGCSKNDGQANPPTAGDNRGIPPGSSIIAPTPISFGDLRAGRYQFKSGSQAGTCLAEVADAEVAGATCNGDAAGQFWKLISVGDGSFRIDSGASGKCLDVSKGSTAAGSEIGTWGYSGAPHQQFIPKEVGSGLTEFSSVKAKGMCLALGSDGGAELAECGTLATQWQLFRVTQSPTIGRGLDASGCVASPALAVKPLTETSLAQLAILYDVNADDDLGSDDWYANYGKRPEFIATASGTGLDVLMRDDSVHGRGVLVHLEAQGKTLAVSRAWEVGLLDEVMGFAAGENGMRYYATAINEESALDADKSRIGVHRPGIVRLVGFDETGCVRLEVDLDLARGYVKADSTLIINPMKASTGRLTYGNGILSLVHGLNTDADSSGVRHQMSLTTEVSVASGEVVRTETLWVSHSMDERQIWDGSAFVELHLGDSYPRGLVMGRFTPDIETDGYLPFRAKGSGNATYTRLGGIAQIASGDYGYLIAFSTERSPTVDEPRGPRDLAMMRVLRNFYDHDSKTEIIVDPNTDTQQLNSEVTNHLVWLTDYGKSGDTDGSAERPRVLELGGNQFLIAWEHWTKKDFEGTWALVVDGSGQVVKTAARVSSDHISRGDDAVRVGNEAALVLGSEGKLVVNLIDAELNARRVVVP